MNWIEAFAFVAAPAFLVYALFQMVTAFSWTNEKSARLRRGPTNSPGETIWLVISAIVMMAILFN
jgi:hypothetical protein